VINQSINRLFEDINQTKAKKKKIIAKKKKIENYNEFRQQLCAE